MQSTFKDWGDARVFLAVVREGSTLAAARVLGVNQTTVARRIVVLEHALGLELFDKTTRGACPTETAQRLIPLAEALEDAAQAFEAEAIAEQSRSAPPIRITAHDNVMLGRIGQVINAFIEKNPTVTFEFIASERFLDLCKGEADIAVRFSRAINDDRLIVTKLGHSAWTYYASQGYAKQHGLPDCFSDNMEPHRVVLLSNIASKRRNVLRCVSADDMRMAIRNGQAIGPMPTFEGDHDPSLVRCFDPPEEAHLDVWLVTGPEAHKRPEVRRFTAFVAPILRQQLKATLK